LLFKDGDKDTLRTLIRVFEEGGKNKLQAATASLLVADNFARRR
jgi:hypothetical protein